MRKEVEEEEHRNEFTKGIGKNKEEEEEDKELLSGFN